MLEISGFAAVAALVGLGVVGLTLPSTRFGRPTCQALLASRSQTRNIEDRLGHRPIGAGPYQLLTHLPKNEIFHKQIIPAVRPLDLSNRPWENSYNPPAGEIDPVEDHPYLMIGGYFGELKFKMSDLETMDGKPRSSLPSQKHAPIVNEYGWLWLNRKGIPEWHRATLVIVLFALLTLLPWTLRNCYLHGQPVLISTNGGFTFWNGNNPFTTGNAFDVYVGKARAYLDAEIARSLYKE